MKKIYNKPTTDSIQIVGQNSIMVGSPAGYTNPNIPMGGSGSGIIGG